MIGSLIKNWVLGFFYNRFKQTKTYTWLANSSIGALILTLGYIGYLYGTGDADTKAWVDNMVVKVLNIKVETETELNKVHDKLNIPAPLPKFPDNITPAPEPAPTNAVVMENKVFSYAFSGPGLTATVTIPKEVEEYSFVRLTSDKVSKNSDLMVMAVRDNVVVFVETIATSTERRMGLYWSPW